MEEFIVFIQEFDAEIQEKIKKLDFNPNKHRKDITGNTYGRLTVLGRGPDAISSSGHVTSRWWCICSCPAHNITLVRFGNLSSGNTKSCGCLAIEKSTERIKAIGHSMARDISGQTFGELLALEPTEKRNNGSVVWKCKCSCGKIHYVTAHDLIHDRIHSCGHLTESAGVTKIKQILHENNISYVVE